MSDASMTTQATGPYGLLSTTFKWPGVVDGGEVTVTFPDRLDELRKLAADRDEAGVAWWFFLWAELPNAASRDKEN